LRTNLKIAASGMPLAAIWLGRSLSNPFLTSSRKPAERLRNEIEEQQNERELGGVLTLDAAFKPVRESSEANRGRKGGARERYEKSPPFWVGIMSGADFAPTWCA